MSEATAAYGHARAFPGSWSVRQGRDAYLRENGFTVEAYAARWTPARILGVPLRVPNTPRRTIRAWRASRRRSLFVRSGSGIDYGEILSMRVAELRRLLDVPEAGLLNARP